MRPNFLIVSLLLLTVSNFSCTKHQDNINYKLIKATFEEDIRLNPVGSGKVTTMALRNWYNCPDGGIACGTGNTIACSSNQTCPPAQIPPYKSFMCAGSTPATMGCGNGGTGSGCYVQVYCVPQPGTPPQHSASPCNFGSIPMGCFNFPGGPDCSPLVNCQTPPP